MMENRYNTLQELFDDASVVRDKLTQYGADLAASELTEVLEGYWTTSSEAIVELLTSFDAIGASCAENFNSEEMAFLDDVRNGAQSLLDFQ